MKCKNNYKLPLKRKHITIWDRKKSSAHRGYLKYSLDFFAPEGTAIYAALGGKVTYVKQNSNVGGNHRRYWSMGNRIVIKHKNGEHTAYEHMKYKGIKVKVGQIVNGGQLIGYVGSTGYSSEPHLHFEVFREPFLNRRIEGTTLEVSFKELKNIKRK